MTFLAATLLNIENDLKLPLFNSTINEHSNEAVTYHHQGIKPHHKEVIL